MDTTKYTVEVYKADGRKRTGERLFYKADHDVKNLDTLQVYVESKYPTSKGFRSSIHQTYVTRCNIMSGQEFVERYDTPIYCSPASETYWCM